MEIWPVGAQEKQPELGSYGRQAVMLLGVGDLALQSSLAPLGYLHIPWQLRLRELPYLHLSKFITQRQ